MRVIILFVFMFSVSLSVLSAEIKGSVTCNGAPVPFANIWLKGTSFGTTSNEHGSFIIQELAPGKYEVHVSSIGFVSDSISIFLNSNESIQSYHFRLKEIDLNLEEVVVSGTLKETYVSESSVPIEVISPKLFLKSPTAGVFESLGMVNGVRPQMQCNVCNTGDIHINGMEGPYTMVMIDGMPIVSALGSVYGLMGIPNSIIQRIEIQKGPSSTLYGSEAVGGLINIITKSPLNAPLFSADVFGTSYKEMNADISTRYKIGKNLSGIFSGNYFGFNTIWDLNSDGFTDVTLQNRIAGFNKLNYLHKNGKYSTIAIRYYYEDRWGGQTNWTPDFRGTDSVYGESIYTNRFELIGNSPLEGISKNTTIQYSFNNHRQNSAYGNTLFLADQTIGFVQGIKNLTIENHDFTFGLALRYIYYDDNTVITEYADNMGEIVNLPTITFLPGIFIQDEFRMNLRNTILGGIRFDFNSHHGGIVSPRLNWKFQLNENQTFRMGVGNGYRVVNLFSEDHAAFNGARTVVVTESLRPEQSWSANVNYSIFKAYKRSFLTIDANAFCTFFSNKIVADYFTDHTKIIFDNLNGYGINRGIGVQMHMSFSHPLKLSVGATFTDVYLKETNAVGEIEVSRQIQTPPFTSNFVLSWNFKKWKTNLDLSGNIYSPMLLPVLPNDFRPDHSPWFALVNIQLTKEFAKKCQVYAGVKNILNFLPDNPIMRPWDPFDKYTNDQVSNPYGYTFDPGYNYAPVQGIRIILGLRMRIE